MKQFVSLSNFTTFLPTFKLAHKSRFWKPKVSQAIPHYMKQTFRDPFDYPLRTKQEIDQQLQQNPPIYQVFAEFTFIPDLKGDNLHKNSEISVFVNISEMKFSPKQKERFLYLIGPRYKGKDEIRIKVNTFDDPSKNVEKGKEMIYELFLEAIRAPCE